ncbi:hypothetical protein V9T40_006569 [Parthenolecanium corni]|uniref:Uncharacterized protein n=1 Tax=Parthenolecanium corni TaxID=536013 RepID=A0AAN9TMI5_9HEMI
MYRLIVFVVFMLFEFRVASNGQSRYLVYPPGFGNKVQFIVGIGVPASNLPTIQSVTWGYVIKTNYVLPTNITEYGDVRSLRKRSARVSRWDFYQSIADVLNRSGLSGEECIKRSICETSQIKFGTDDIIGELLHIMLLPSSTGDTQSDYYRAELVGLNHHISCASVYNQCPVSIVDLISVVRGDFNFGSFPHPM